MNIANLLSLKFLSQAVTCLVFSAMLAGCGGENSGSTTPDTCSEPQEFKGNRLGDSQRIDALKNQAAINLDQAFSEQEIDALQKTFESILKDTNITDWTLTLAIPGKGSWTQTHIATRTGIEPSEATFWWMSAGKLFTSAIIFQLIDEGKLTLNTSIDIYFPEIPNGNLITIDQLLTHTSGLYSFQEDPIFRAQKDYIGPAQLLQIALSHKPEFCPGTRWHYSNTGYLLLGLIIEKNEAKQYDQVIRDRITTPFGLNSTFALQGREFPSHLILNRDGTTPSVPFAAGNIVSNAEGMVRYLQLILTGQIYSPSLLAAAIENPYRMFDSELFYGRGIISYVAPEDNINWIGHSGGSETANALVAYDFASNTYIAISVNDPTPAAAIAARFFSTTKSF